MQLKERKQYVPVAQNIKGIEETRSSSLALVLSDWFTPVSLALTPSPSPFIFVVFIISGIILGGGVACTEVPLNLNYLSSEKEINVTRYFSLKSAFLKLSRMYTCN